MKSYGDPVSTDRLCLPVVENFPIEPKLGEVLYLNVAPRQGIYIFTPEGWIPLYASVGNIWEKHKAVKDQQLFNLDNFYNPDGRSINVYVDGVRLQGDQFSEIAPQLVSLKEECQGGEVVEFQIFNQRVVQPFDLKGWNRRVADVEVG